MIEYPIFFTWELVIAFNERNGGNFSKAYLRHNTHAESIKRCGTKMKSKLIIFPVDTYKLHNCKIKIIDKFTTTYTTERGNDSKRNSRRTELIKLFALANMAWFASGFRLFVLLSFVVQHLQQQEEMETVAFIVVCYRCIFRCVFIRATELVPGHNTKTGTQ